MTRTQAWQKVAEAFDGGSPLGCCLCLAMARLGHFVTAQMLTLGRQMGRPALWWPCRCGSEGAAFDGERATFAGLMAAMTQRERDQLVEGL